MCGQIGTQSDTKPFRDRIGKVMAEVTTVIKNCSNEIKEYKDI